MAQIDFQYTITAEALVGRESTEAISDFLQYGALFHTVPTQPGLWAVNGSGELVNNAAQDSYSGVYRGSDLGLTDYAFTLPMTGSTLDNNIIGCHFRFIDRDNFYFLAWDRGGVFGGATRKPSLRLYKRMNGQHTLLAFKTGVAWDPARMHEVKVSVVGSSITIAVDGTEYIKYSDNSAPFLAGAYGPLTYHQRGARFRDVHFDALAVPFTVSEDFSGSMPEDAYDANNPVQVSVQALADLMRPAAAAWCATQGYDPNQVEFQRFTLMSPRPDVSLYLDRYTKAAVSEDPLTYVWGHRIRILNLPAAPTDLMGVLQPNNGIIWSWTDNSNNELGFLVMDEKGQILADLPPNTQYWLETGLASDTIYYRQVVAYNDDGRSKPTHLVSVRTGVMPPLAPLNFTGTAIGPHTIRWTWTDPNQGTAPFRMRDESGNLVVHLPAGTTFYLEENLLPNTTYTRSLVAYNSMGESAAAEATATTPADLPNPDALDAPEVFFGAPVSETEIEWTWEYSKACDGFRLYDELGTLIATVPGHERSFREGFLSPGETYHRRLTAFNAAGESDFSEMASATTLTFDEEEEVPYAPVSRLNYGERLEAFQSGVGDGMDLKVLGPSTKIVKPSDEEGPRVQWMTRRIRVYPAVNFRFRFKGTGIRRMAENWSRFAGTITSYPLMSYQARVDGEVNEPYPFTWEAKLDGRYVASYNNTLDWVTWTAGARCKYLEGYDPVVVPFTWTATAVGEYVSARIPEIDNAMWVGAAEIKYLSDPQGPTWSTATIQSAEQEALLNSDTHKDPASASQLTPGTLAEFMEPFIADFKAQHGLDDDEIQIIGYNVSTTSQTATIYTDQSDGSAPVFGYTSLRGTPVWSTATITTPEQHETVDSTYPTEDAAKQITAGTLAEFMVPFADDFRAQHNLEPDELVLTSYSVATATPDVVVLTDAADGSEPVRAYTTQSGTERWADVVLSADLVTSAIETDFYRSASNAKRLSSLTVADMLKNVIAEFKSQNGLTDDQLVLEEYVISTTSQTATVFTNNPDGSDWVWGYTSLTKAPVWAPMTLSTGPITGQITEDHHDLATALDLVSGQTPADLLAPALALFKSSSNLSDSEIQVDSYSVHSHDAVVILNTDPAGTSTVKAYTTASTRYTGSRIVSGTVRALDGKVAAWNPATDPLMLFNRDGQPYTGASAAYTLTDLSGNPAITLTWEDGSAGQTPHAQRLMVETTAKASRDFDVLVTVGGSVPVAPAAPDPTWTGILYEVTKKPGMGEEYTASFAYFANNPALRASNDGDAVRGNVEVVVETDIRYVTTAWDEVGQWQVGVVNGREPIITDGDGKADFETPIILNIPDDLESATFEIEVDSPIPLDYHWTTSPDLTSTDPDDTVVFTSDYMDDLEREVPVVLPAEVSGRPTLSNQEIVSYELQLIGKIPDEIEVYPELPFAFRFKGTGTQKIPFEWSRFAGEVAAYPLQTFRAQVHGQAQVPEPFRWTSSVELDYVTGYDKATDVFEWTGKVDGVRFFETTESMADVFHSWTKFGSATWQYNATTDEVYTTSNTSSLSGFYDPKAVPGGEKERRNYTVSAIIRIPENGDNDMIGMAFRIQNSSNYYYVGWMRNSSYLGPSGWGNGGALLRLYKVVSGKHTLLGSSSALGGWQPDTEYHLEVEAVGSSLKVRIDGVQYISCVDDTFQSGAYGPITYSQAGCHFKNLTGIRTEPFTISATPLPDSVTSDNHDPATAKSLMAITLAEHMEPYVEDFLVTNNLDPADFRLDRYYATTTSPTVTTIVDADGSSPVRAYTSLARAPIWGTVTLNDTPQAATITEQHHSSGTKAVVSTQTAADLLADEILAFRTANGLSASEVKPKRYFVTSDNPKVIVSTNPDGSGRIEAYTTAGTIYAGTKLVTGSVRHTDGTVLVPVTLTLENKLGEPYTGSTATYTLTDAGSDPGVTVTWEDGTIGQRNTLIQLAAYTTTMATWTFDEPVSANGLTPVAIPVFDPSWTDVRYAVTKLQMIGEEYGPSYAFFSSDPDTRAIDPGDTVYGAGDLLLGTGIRYVISPWEEESPWYEGALNGLQPLVRDGDGKQNYRSGIALDIPPTVTDLNVAVEIQQDPARPELSTITAQWETTTQPTTDNPFDIVTFSSNYTARTERTSYWMGQKVRGGPVVVDPAKPLIFTELVPSPVDDPTWQALPVKPTEYILLINTDNANVKIVLTNGATIDWMTPGNIQAQLMATVRNPLQGTWNPRIHSGYYYLNNEEFYLYVEDDVRGQLEEREEVAEVPVIYTVELNAERLVTAQTRAFGQAENPADGETGFDAGVGSGVDWSQGYLTLAPGAISGEYMAPVQVCDYEADWSPLTLDADIPAGTSVQLYTRSYSSNGWSNWGPHDATPRGTRMECRAVIKGAEVEVVYDDQIPTDLSQIADADRSNVTLIGGILRLEDIKAGRGKVMGPVIDLGDPSFIKTMGKVAVKASVPQGTRLTFRTVSASSPDGPWDGSGQPQTRAALGYENGLLVGTVGSIRNRYMRWLIEMETTGTDSPEVEAVTVIPQRSRMERLAPIIRAIRGVASTSNVVTPITHRAEFRVNVPGDQEWHRVTTDTVADLIDASLTESSTPLAGIGNRSYTVSTSTPGVEVQQTADGHVEVRTVDRHTRQVIDHALVVVDNDAAFINPIPQQGAPLVIYDSRSKVMGPLRQVHFTDEDGRPSLDNTYTTTHAGGRYVTLPFTDVDPDYVTVKVDWEGNGRYTELLGWTLTENLLRLPVKVDAGVSLRISLRLRRSYVVDYNFDVENDTAQVLFHQVEPFPDGRVEVHYETSKNSAYLVAKEIELNPLMTPLTTGFIYLTDRANRADKVEIHVNPDTIVANGYDLITVYVRALDEYGNPVPDRLVRLWSDKPDVELRLNRTRTDRNGLITAVLTAPPMPEIITLTAVIDGATATKRVVAERERISASLSLEGDPTVSGAHPARITGRILGPSLRYEPGITIRFITSAGILVRPGAVDIGTRSLDVVTGPDGEATVELKVLNRSGLKDGDMVIIRAEAILLDNHTALTETINVKYEEV